MTRSPGPEAGFAQRSAFCSSLRLIHAVAASLAVAVMVLSISLLLALASTQTSIAMPFAH